MDRAAPVLSWPPAAMKILTIRHETVYRYATAVRFGEHRLIFRPRDSHDLRLLETSLELSPPAKVRWIHDVHGNSIAIATFEEEASELRLVSIIRIEHYGLSDPDFLTEPYASVYPFSYSSEEFADLAPCLGRHCPDPERKVDVWARSFLSGPTTPTRDLLVAMTQAIKEQFTYAWRDDEGTQPPLLTLERKSGSCRDLALFMMEAARSLGLAARFVTGYLYDPALDGGDAGMQGSGATHAWAQIYLPGAGWVEFDPTNGLVGGANLVRVAVARDPAQAIPLSGSYFGARDAFIEMRVNVTVKAD
jgi:transglutaminase-like putative cysteine protease